MSDIEKTYNRIVDYKNKQNIPPFDSYFIGTVDNNQIILTANLSGIDVTQKDKFGTFRTLTLTSDEALKIVQPFLRKLKVEQIIKKYEIHRSNNR
jgi:hypothetical protein